MGTGFGQTGASFRGGDKASLTIRRVSEAGPNIVLGQFGEIGQDLLMGLAGGKPTEYIRNRNPHVADAGTAAALTGVDRNDVLILHKKDNSTISGSTQQPTGPLQPQVSCG